MRYLPRQDPSHRYALDTRSSEELVKIHRKRVDSDEDDWEAMAILQFRGGEKEFDIGQQLTESDDPEYRCIGADILGQLGWEDKTFLDETVDILIELLNDPSPCVIYHAALGLGFRNHERAIAPLIKLIRHKDHEIRFAVTHGLSMHDDERAVSALIELSRDSDFDVRNWAIFGIGSLTEIDNPEVRDALIAGLDDPDSEIRGEALVGLARRKDPRAYDAILKEWDLDEISSLSIEAAGELADPSFLPFLNELQETLDLTDDEIFQSDLSYAISECQQSMKNDSNQN